MMSTQEYERLTLAFYNIENLFDIEDDPYTNDEDYLPNSAKRWTSKRYHNKLLKIGLVISKIGAEDSVAPPALVGLAEVENQQVVEDLINSPYLKNIPYGMVHYDSMDERGIDVALLYHKDLFELTSSETFSVYLENDHGERDYTRDILLVEGLLKGTPTFILVNHWSSRREGDEETEPKRLIASEKVLEIIERIRSDNPEAHIVVMGDFNDNPNDLSITTLETKAKLFNPFKTVWSERKGSLNHDFQWDLFDQILLSSVFLTSESSRLRYDFADVFNHEFVTQYHGKYKGQPFRTYVGKRYMGGYSDHFPVYVELKTPNTK